MVREKDRSLLCREKEKLKDQAIKMLYPFCRVSLKGLLAYIEQVEGDNLLRDIRKLMAPKMYQDALRITVFPLL